MNNHCHYHDVPNSPLPGVEETRFRAECTLTGLPFELLMTIFKSLRPSDLFRLCRVSKFFKQLILQHEQPLASAIISYRYRLLGKCFRLPVPVNILSQEEREALQTKLASEVHQSKQTRHRHLSLPSYSPSLCICYVCTTSWINLNIILNLSHWRATSNWREESKSETPAKNNNALLIKHSAIVARAMERPLAYAAVLEKHLATTVKIWRQEYLSLPDGQDETTMSTSVEAWSDTDTFLERGPANATTKIYVERDRIYGLNIWLPGRKWDCAADEWTFSKGLTHETCMDWLIFKMKQWKRRGLLQ